MKTFFKKLKLKRRIVALLAALHFFGNPSKKLKIVGVTGTNGKTTTATLLYRIATALGYKAGLIGTVENIIAGEIEEATHTTPDPIALNKLLSKMVIRGCEYVFMEVSSHALDQGRVAGITFTGGIFTNLTQDHFDYHKNIENYFRAKKKFFKMLPAEAFALSNADDDYGRKMLEGTPARKFFYGFKEKENFQGEIVKLDFSGLRLKFNQTTVKSKLLGQFNAYNLLAVWGACKLLGFDMDRVNKIIQNIKPPKGRFDHFISKSRVLVVVDYAHTPDALEKVFLTVREVKPKDSLPRPNGRSKIISVFGCGGDRDSAKRPLMGIIGASFSDVAIFTSDNPRSEDPNKIIADMKAALYPDMLSKVKQIANRSEAIQEAVKLSEEGDVILVAGKGHEDYQEIKGVKYHFDDMEELKKAFQEK